MVRGFGSMKAKTHKDVEQLRQRVANIRDKFSKHPEINWRLKFKSQYNVPDWKWKNVYYLRSTDEKMTEQLEKLWDEFNNGKS